MNSTLRKTMQLIVCTLGILIGLAGATVLAAAALDSTSSTSTLSTQLFLFVNQGWGTTAYYGVLMFSVAGALAFRALDERRIAAERKAAGL